MNNLRQRGFTLIELIIFIVVVGIGLAGILLVINTVVKSSADPMVRKQTIAIAESLLEEILLKDYADPNGGTNGRTACIAGGTADTRHLWDDVCDYNGYTSSSIVDLTGAGSGPAGYSISPAVAVDTVALGSLTTVKRVIVSVTGPQGAVVRLTGYRANDRP